MLTLYTGLYENLTPPQQRAILKLTMRRYVEAIHLPEYLEQTQGLQPGTYEYEQTFASTIDAIKETLSNFDQHTYVSALLLPHEADEWIALASMRILQGHRADVKIGESVGCADSSIPTHTLLQSFHYPQLPDFDAAAVTEAEIFEVSRLVAADHELAEQLITVGVMSQTEIQAVLPSALDELIVNFYRNEVPAMKVAAWIFNVKPKLAVSLKLRKGLDLIPLFLYGAEPTALALSSALDKPYFQRWHTELYRFIPDTIERDGTLAAIRYLASRDIREWQDCELSLPYLLVNNAELERAIEKLESKLAQRSYGLTQVMAYA